MDLDYLHKGKRRKGVSPAGVWQARLRLCLARPVDRGAAAITTVTEGKRSFRTIQVQHERNSKLWDDLDNTERIGRRARGVRGRCVAGRHRISKPTSSPHRRAGCLTVHYVQLVGAMTSSRTTLGISVSELHTQTSLGTWHCLNYFETRPDHAHQGKLKGDSEVHVLYDVHELHIQALHIRSDSSEFLFFFLLKPRSPAFRHHTKAKLRARKG